jgi:hypothetical protein
MEARYDVEKEQIEILDIAPANAIVDPRTMMVHLENAHTTNTAMMCPIWFVLATPFANTSLA